MNKMRCPLSCGQTFNTKNELIEHLSDHVVEFNCPICQTSYSSISNLLNHLKLTTCRPSDNFSVTSADTSLNEIAQVEPNKNYDVPIIAPKLEHTQGNSNSDIDDCKYKSDITKEDNDLTELQEATLEDANMYEELLEKDGLQGSDLNLLDENGHNRYTIVTHDGTISITSAKDNQEDASQMKLEDIEPVITVADKDPESNEQEVYSCNTCGVSFSSVLDHIQNYHKDQDVVVEVNEQSQNGDGNESLEEDKETVIEVQPVDSVTSKEESTETAETQTTRRVITDTGDIVETATELLEVAGDTAKSIPLSLLEEEVLDKKGRVFTRRYVQIGKLNRTEPEAEEPTQPKVPYHQVVVKEIMTMDGGAKVKVYNCVSCQIYVMNLDEFKSHPCKALKYTCPQCPVSYGNAKSLCAHMKVHKVTRQTFSAKSPAVPPIEIMEPITVYPPESRTLPYKCDVCSTIFPTNKSLKLHKRMHDPIKSRPIEPPVEESSDPTEDSSEKYFCAHCNKWIPVGYRTVHNNFHKSTENFNCDICNKKFTSSSYLLMHMTVHNTDKVKVKKLDKTLPYTCLYCNRQFARPHEKVKHERIHTGEKPHSCEICGKSFRVSYCLTLHMRTHTGARPYACQHCGKRFKAHSVYNHHLLTHSDVRAYKCPYCPKAFKTSVQLAGHKNSHTKPFACEHCNRPFASLYAVRVHTETHRRQNSLKYNCETCGASYARSFALKDHMRQAHQQELRPADAFDSVSSVTLVEEKDWALENTEESTAPAHKEDFQEINDLAMSSNESETVMA